ncbi:hypothetical protein GCM10023084_29580 [Streptomyces lacrimifluminis]|uniref:Uncharacterized protein n=1 Tax=Streptomyces lacrimifluminis TaxID=1500077 RepID=A0A917KUE8_9ACTN|nr:hypothetical protein GCM10012282_26200 [Streptomyces lacrimifluminis]
MVRCCQRSGISGTSRRRRGTRTGAACRLLTAASHLMSLQGLPGAVPGTLTARTGAALVTGRTAGLYDGIVRR